MVAVGCGTRRRCVPRCAHALTDLEPVLFVEGVEQLRVGVEELLAGVGIG